MAGMTQPRVTHRRVDIDGYPTQCCRCGQPIVKKRHDSQQHYDHATRTATSWHTTCTTFAAPAASRAAASGPGRLTLGRGQRGVPSTTQHEQEFAMREEPTGTVLIQPLEAEHTTTEPEPEPQPEPQPEPDPDPDDEK